MAWPWCHPHMGKVTGVAQRREPLSLFFTDRVPPGRRHRAHAAVGAGHWTLTTTPCNQVKTP